MKLDNLINRFAFAHKRQTGGLCAVCTDATGVYVAQVKRGAAKPQVMRCQYHPAPALNASLLEKIAKDEKISSFHISTLLAANEYQIQLVEGVNVPPEEFKSAVRWRIKDTLDYSIDDAAIDVLQIPSGRSGAAKPSNALLAIAAPGDIIKQRIELFENARLNLTVIDVPAMAQRNVATLFEQSGRGLALLSFDESGGLLTVTCDGELYMQRRIDVTQGQLSDADDFLRAQSRERVALELQRSLDYFGRQYNWISLQRLLIVAPARMALVQALAPSLEVPVEPLNLAEVLDISATPDLADDEFAAQMFMPLGAALRDERRPL